jgi:phosphoglycolate phosphatase
MKQKILKLVKTLTMIYLVLSSAQAAIFKSCKDSDIAFPEAIIFDWDSTLTDAWPLLLETWNRTLREAGKPPLTLKELHAFPHIPQEDMITLMFGEKRPDVTKNYWQHYERVHQGPIPLVPGTLELLKFLKEKGVYVAILSNQKGDVLRKNVIKAGLMPYIDKVVGAGDAPKNKPDILSAKLALDQSQLTLNPQSLTYKIWLIGDSQTDLDCAANSGVLGVWVTDKASQNIEISDAGKHPILTISTIIELKNLLEKFQK